MYVTTNQHRSVLAARSQAVLVSYNSSFKCFHWSIWWSITTDYFIIE